MIDSFPACSQATDIPQNIESFTVDDVYFAMTFSQG